MSFLAVQGNRPASAGDARIRPAVETGSRPQTAMSRGSQLSRCSSAPTGPPTSIYRETFLNFSDQRDIIRPPKGNQTIRKERELAYLLKVAEEERLNDDLFPHNSCYREGYQNWSPEQRNASRGIRKPHVSSVADLLSGKDALRDARIATVNLRLALAKEKADRWRYGLGSRPPSANPGSKRNFAFGRSLDQATAGIQRPPTPGMSGRPGAQQRPPTPPGRGTQQQRPVRPPGGGTQQQRPPTSPGGGAQQQRPATPSGSSVAGRAQQVEEPPAEEIATAPSTGAMRRASSEGILRSTKSAAPQSYSATADGGGGHFKHRSSTRQRQDATKTLSFKEGPPCCEAERRARRKHRRSHSRSHADRRAKSPKTKEQGVISGGGATAVQGPTEAAVAAATQANGEVPGLASFAPGGTKTQSKSAGPSGSVLSLATEVGSDRGGLSYLTKASMVLVMRGAPVTCVSRHIG